MSVCCAAEEMVEYYTDDGHFNETSIAEPFEEALSQRIQIFLICLYTVTAVVSLCGNVTAIWVLLAGKRSSRELRIFLVNLSMSDITMALFSIPFTYTDFMLNRWIFDPLFCPFVQFMQLCSVFVSVYTLTAIGIDRYVAIMYPLVSSRWTKSYGLITIGVIWVLGISLASVQLIHSKAEEITYKNVTYYDCHEVWSSAFHEKLYTMAIFIITFALPMTVLIFTYASIGWKMFKHTSPGNADALRDEAQLLQKAKVVKMLATVVVLFAICWLPLQAFLILHWFRVDFIDTSTDQGFGAYMILFFVCHWLAMANSCVNPIVYCFMSENFRADLRFLAKCCCPRIKGNAKRRNANPKPGSMSYGSSFRTTMFMLNHNSPKVTNGRCDSRQTARPKPKSKSRFAPTSHRDLRSQGFTVSTVTTFIPENECI